MLTGGERLDFLLDVKVEAAALWDRASPSVSLEETMFAFTFCRRGDGIGIVVVIDFELSLSVFSRSLSWAVLLGIIFGFGFVMDIDACGCVIPALLVPVLDD